MIRALAALAWPILVGVVLYVFKKEFRDILSRLRRGKILGQEIELERALDQLQETATAATREVPAQPAVDTIVDEIEVTRKQVLELAATSPKAALMLLASKIERELREFMKARGLPFFSRSVSQSLEALMREHGVPPHVVDSVRQLWDVRHRIVHGRGAAADDVLRAIDSGLNILVTVRALRQQGG